MGMPFRRFPSFPVALITVAALLVPAAALGDPPPPGRGAPSGSAPASRATPPGPASAPTQDAAPATIPVPGSGDYKGIGASARDMADLLPPELLRFLMIRTKPNSPVNFDVHEEGIVKLFNE